MQPSANATFLQTSNTLSTGRNAFLRNELLPSFAIVFREKRERERRPSTRQTVKQKPTESGPWMCMCVCLSVVCLSNGQKRGRTKKNNFPTTCAGPPSPVVALVQPLSGIAGVKRKKFQRNGLVLRCGYCLPICGVNHHGMLFVSFGVIRNHQSHRHDVVPRNAKYFLFLVHLESVWECRVLF